MFFDKICRGLKFVLGGLKSVFAFFPLTQCDCVTASKLNSFFRYIYMGLAKINGSFIKTLYPRQKRADQILPRGRLKSVQSIWAASITIFRRFVCFIIF